MHMHRLALQKIALLLIRNSKMRISLYFKKCRGQDFFNNIRKPNSYIKILI